MARKHDRGRRAQQGEPMQQVSSGPRQSPIELTEEM
jgi:hypothetical protein